MQQKQINTGKSKQEHAFTKLNTLVERQMSNSHSDQTVVYPDACYMLSAIDAEMKVSDLVLHLSKRATVVLMQSVLDEVQRNVMKAEFNHVNRSMVLADIATLHSISQANPTITIENVDVSNEIIAGLSEKMKLHSVGGNCRVGAGEAAIYTHLMSVKELFKQAFVLSIDADVSYIFANVEGVAVIGSDDVKKKITYEAQTAVNAEAPSRVQTVDDLISDIKFDDSTEGYILSKGLRGIDVVLAICRGFDFWKNNAAVMGIHRRGSVIRNNLRRYCGEKAEAVLSFLKSVDILKDDFGSSASTKTKDDAMSINIHPKHEVGKKIISSIQAVVYEYRKQSNPRAV
ncbi:MAG: hypothetical protein N3G76_02540 [Candidatus Micrarchaeota archaeon]|nr:hypothetical protein [Candidatus Micrarchaeota archaeon]